MHQIHRKLSDLWIILNLLYQFHVLKDCLFQRLRIQFLSSFAGIIMKKIQSHKQVNLMIPKNRDL